MSIVFKKSLHDLLIIGLICCSFASHLTKAGQRDDFIKAKEAYEKSDIETLAKLADSLTKKQYMLAPYAEYWLMASMLDQVTDAQVNQYLIDTQDYPFADKFRGEWLKILALRQDWKSFLALYPQYKGDDASVKCYAAEAKADAVGINTLIEFKSLWMQEKDQPEACDALFDKMQDANVIKENDVKNRFRLVLQNNRISLAKAILNRSNKAKTNTLKGLDAAYKNPNNAINKRLIQQDLYGKEVYLYALERLARKDSEQALSAYKKIKKVFNGEANSYFYGRLALQAAKRQEPEAYDWFKIADKNTQLDENQFEWFARSALRAGDWNGLLYVTNKMSTSQADQAIWRYWRARALKALNQHEQANALFEPLSKERHYYGWLAQDELGIALDTQSQHYIPTDKEVDLIENFPAVQRAIELDKLELTTEAKQEWVHAISSFDDSQLLAAAVLASRKKWYDISINTADKTTKIHNYDLRYPRPYEYLTKPEANKKQIDEAWVYGIIRQESRFIHEAKSRTGAAGLMQIMPATAKWIANKMNVSGFSQNKIYDLDMNINLGTHYMKHVLTQFNGQETMTTAAYNAGPSRAKKWQANVPLDGTIYAETIPFDETRNYVKRVMANAHIYANRLGLNKETLKTRMGIIPAKDN